MTDLLSPSPYAYLDALPPAERQAEIARRQHGRREDWCDDARRARDYQAEAATLEAAAVANIESYETSLSECLSRIAELEAALKPFAQEADLQDAVRAEHGLADSEQVDCYHATLSDMDRARSALRK